VGKIKVISPEGIEGTISESQREAALDAGYKIIQ
jgi:hypothetical protein